MIGVKSLEYYFLVLLGLGLLSRMQGVCCSSDMAGDYVLARLPTDACRKPGDVISFTRASVTLECYEMHSLEQLDCKNVDLCSRIFATETIWGMFHCLWFESKGNH